MNAPERGQVAQEEQGMLGFKSVDILLNMRSRYVSQTSENSIVDRVRERQSITRYKPRKRRAGRRVPPPRSKSGRSIQSCTTVCDLVSFQSYIVVELANCSPRGGPQRR